MRNVVSPKSVSFEEALRNLASRLTGHPTAELPRTQEGIVQFMAENVPSLAEMGEAVTREVLARLAEAAPEQEPPADTEPPEDDPAEAATEAHNGPQPAGGTSTPAEEEKPTEGATAATGRAKRTAKANK